jgi:hypothetical protein
MFVGGGLSTSMTYWGIIDITTNTASPEQRENSVDFLNAVQVQFVNNSEFLYL